MMTKRLLAEFVGTFALVFIGAGAAAGGFAALEGVALAHGLTLMAMVFAFGSLSGAHVNPAVTFGVMLGGEISVGDAIQYMIAQLLGGIAAGFALLLALGGAVHQLGATTLAAGVSPWQGVWIEGILAFFLVTVVFRAAVRGHAGKAAGVAIGLTLAADILLGGPYTGASVNPARTLGPAVAAGVYSDIWVYFIGTAAGAAVAAGLDWFLERS
jgi:MIP family channel proteins